MDFRVFNSATCWSSSFLSSARWLDVSPHRNILASQCAYLSRKFIDSSSELVNLILKKRMVCFGGQTNIHNLAGNVLY